MDSPDRVKRIIDSFKQKLENSNTLTLKQFNRQLKSTTTPYHHQKEQEIPRIPRHQSHKLIYLTGLRYLENKRVAQLKTSSRQYDIETGKHGQNRGNIANRICTTCSKNDDDTFTLPAELPFSDPIVEDETRVIQTCPLYENLVKKLKAPT